MVSGGFDVGGVPVATAITCGAGIGAGLALIVFGFRPRRPALAELLDRLHRAPEPVVGRRDRWRLALAAPSLHLGFPGAATQRDLAAAGVDQTQYLAGQGTAVIVGALAGPAIGWLVLGAGEQAPLWLGLLGAAAGWWLQRASLRADAERARAAVRHALSVMLTLMSVSLARGAGIEQALDEAAEVCTGPGTTCITDAIRTARLLRRPPWDRLADYGTAAGIPELSDLAAAMRLAGTDGARIRAALAARAAAMRTAATASAHADAERATSRMTLPLLLLACSYLLFLMFPAVAALNLTP